MTAIVARAEEAVNAATTPEAVEAAKAAGLAAVREQYEKEHGVRGIDAMRPFLNPNSLNINTGAFIEAYARTLPALTYLQFQRTGYFNIDPDSTPDHLVFNSTVSLKDRK